MSKKLIKSFEEACKAQGLDPKKVLPDVSAMPEQDQKAIIALAKMCIIQRSLNGDWKADWSDGSQPKFYPWFDVNPDDNGPSGFGLSCNVYVCDSSFSFLGAHLCLATAIQTLPARQKTTLQSRGAGSRISGEGDPKNKGNEKIWKFIS